MGVISHIFLYNGLHCANYQQGMLDMNTTSQRLWLIGPKNIQNSLLLGYLQQNINYSCAIIDPYTQADNHNIHPENFICLDASGLNYERYQQILEWLPNENKVFFINLDHDKEHERLLQWPNVCGFFYKGNSHTHISHGLASIVNGELWFSRKLLSRFMANNRKSPSKIPDSIYSLTKREKQILNLSASGAKNAEIAEALNVSTHTVKTHMYNLFKKIDVSNRIQAINWAKEHLPVQDVA
jgi:LuxR family transcriptional regulator of csgAB operon